MHQTSLFPSMFEDVGAFHVLVLKELPPSSPTLVSQDWQLERFRFLNEELTEYLSAALTGNMIGTIDGLLDLIYVALGTLWQMGVPADKCWKVIHHANMQKQRGVTSRGNEVDAVKPEGWVGPESELARIIAEMLDASDT